MTDRYIGKPVLKHCYCEHEYKNQIAKRCIKKVPKVKKKDVLKAGIEPRMVNKTPQLSILCLAVRNSTFH